MPMLSAPTSFATMTQNTNPVNDIIKRLHIGNEGVDMVLMATFYMGLRQVKRLMTR